MASSVGTGQVIRECWEREGIKRIVMGSGGSAFVDGGIGAMQALDVFKFMDRHG